MIGFGWKDILGLADSLGLPINPATEEKQDDIINAINGISGGGATDLGTGSQNVTTAGTRVQLSAVSVAIRRIHIRAKATNTGFIFVGGTSVSSTSGLYLQTMDSITLNISNLNAIWIDSTVNGEGITYTYEA